MIEELYKIDSNSTSLQVLIIVLGFLPNSYSFFRLFFSSYRNLDLILLLVCLQNHNHNHPLTSRIEFVLIFMINIYI